MLSRRRLLRYGGVAGAAGLVLGMPGEPGWSGAGSAGLLSTFTTRVTRREDQLALTVDGVNLRLAKVGETGPGDIGTARLVRVDAAADAYLVIKFGPQSIVERAYEEIEDDPDGGDTAQLTTPTEAALAGESRLAFRVPGAVTSIPYTLAGLLGWSRLLPSVVPNALRTVSGKPAPTMPDAPQTWIEAPWRVVLSSHDRSGWAHVVDLPAPEPGSRAELWHTRLGVASASGVDEQNTGERTVRAVWTPNFEKLSPPDINDLDPLGKTSLSPRQRYEVVRLSSDYSIVDHTVPYLPRPLEVERLVLSSLGAWLHTRGSWPAPVAPPDIAFPLPSQVLETESWLHRATFGRDHYVRVVSVGCFLPTRHPAALVEVTERKFQGVRDVPFFDPRRGRPAAFLRKRIFLVPRGGWQLLPANVPGLPYDGREMPFKRVRITTVMTPSLAPVDGNNPDQMTRVPKDPANAASEFWGKGAFWPVVPVPGGGMADFRFALEAEDAELRISQFSLPLIFVSESLLSDPTEVQKLISYYDTDVYSAATRRTAELGGQQVALAKFTSTRGEPRIRCPPSPSVPRRPMPR